MGNSGSLPPMVYWTVVLLMISPKGPPPTAADPIMPRNIRVSEYFGESDLTKVTWAHAVNSQDHLNQSLANGVMMLEADILMGTDTSSLGDSFETVAIMAHPPATESDLSFEEFFRRVLKANKSSKNKNRKGIKLDFKDMDAVGPVLAAIERLRSKKKPLDFPIWVNADIWKGPYQATQSPLDPNAFLSAFVNKEEVHFIPTLSLGWTTRYGNETGDSSGGHISTGSYTSEQISEALQTLSSFKVDGAEREVTFPVRAGLAANSLDNLVNLMGQEGLRATLTIWSKEGDYVDMGKLEHLIQTVGRERIYLDVPFDLVNYPQEKFVYNATTPSTSSNKHHGHVDNDVDNIDGTTERSGSSSSSTSSTTEKPSKKSKKDKQDKDLETVEKIVDKSAETVDKIVDDARHRPRATPTSTPTPPPHVSGAHVTTGLASLIMLLFICL